MSLKASLTQQTWILANSRRWWRTGKPGMLQSMGSQESDTTQRLNNWHCLKSVQFSRSVVSDAATPWTAARQACLSMTNSRSPPKPMSIELMMLSTISSSVFPFSSCPQSFPASGSFQMSQLFASGGQNTGVWASISVLSINTQDWSPLGWTGWISSQSKGL